MPRRTIRRRRGDRAEQVAVAYLEALGWHVIARNLAVGRDEIDVLAMEPGDVGAIVCVEVRSSSSGRFGAPEESVVGRKIARLYRSMAAVRAAGVLPGGVALPRGLPWRVDLLAIDDAPFIGPDAGGPTIRHLRGVEPG